jgi:hypothetical protein
MKLFTKILFLSSLLVLAIVGKEHGQATDLLAVQKESQAVWLEGNPGRVSTKRLTQRQLKAIIEDAKKKGWYQTEKKMHSEMVAYQLERKEQQLKLSFWPRQQVVVVTEINTKKSYQKELLSMLSHPPGQLQLTFATRTKDGVCLFACTKAGPGMIATYLSRLEQSGWHRWFTGQVELWERKGERLGITRAENGIMVVWLQKKGGRELGQL